MAIPSVSLLSNQPGGGVVAALGGINSLAKQQLENQYYAPNIESEIANRNALTQGQNITNQYLPQKLQLENAFSQLQNKYYAPNILSEIANRQANTNNINTMTPLNAVNQQNINDWYARKMQSDIAANQALAQYRQMGGSGLGAGDKEELFYQNLVSKENPQLKNDPNLVYEASNVIRNGGDTLSNGIKLNAISPAIKGSLDRLAKYGTYAGAANPLINAVGAEKEIDVLNKYAQEGLKPYGTTYFGKSPQQILDTFKDDNESQDRLGKFIGAQQLQFEIAQNQNRIAMGQPGITNTQELMDRSMQMIDASYPKLSYTARKAASDYFTKGLKEALQARKSAGIGAYITPNSTESSKKDPSEMTDDEIRAELAQLRGGK